MVQLTPPTAANDPDHTDPQTAVQHPAPPTRPAPVAVGGKQVDSNALTEDSISSPALPDLKSDTAANDNGFTNPPPVFGEEIPEASDPNAAGATAGPLDWHNQKSAKTRRVAMLVAVGLASLISALVMFTVIRRNWSGSTPVTASTGPADVNADSNDAGDSPAAPSQNAEAETPPSTATTEPGPTDTASTESTEPATENPEPPSETSSEPSTAQEPSEQMTEPIDPAIAPPADLLPTNPLLPQSPLDGLLPIGNSPLDPATGDAPDAPTMKALPDDLKKLLLGLDFDRPQLDATQPAPPTIDEIQLDRAADVVVNPDVMVQRPDPINMRQALGLSLALNATSPDGYPLNDLLLVLSQVSGVPIEVEWVSFELVGSPIEQNVIPPRGPEGWLTVEELLTGICESAGATFETNERSITVRPLEERFENAINQILDFSDLPSDSDSAVATARALLGQTEGDVSKVSVPAESGPQQLAALVCEAIRRARGVEGRVADRALLRWAGRYQDLIDSWPRLQGGKSGAPHVQRTTFVSLVRQIARLNQATCYINWQDAFVQGVSATDKMMPHTGPDVTAAAVMDQLLTPSGLHVRAVDRDHWWIGSDASFDRFPVVVWFDGAGDPQRTQAVIEQMLAGTSDQTISIGAVAIEPVSNRCIAVLPRYLLRQLPRLLPETNGTALTSP
ncbi:hypothetical protein NHH03_16105 [Stieleria sp. TO1_6]|nr:hypothetical protein [Stieleria tagensis]